MKILVITQMFSQPDDVGDNKPTKTVNYFVKEWVAMGNEVVVMHCPSKFPYVLYKLPDFVKNQFANRISTMVPPIKSRQSLEREENGARIFRIPMFKFAPGHAYSPYQMKKCADKIIKKLQIIGFEPELVLGHFANPSTELVSIIAQNYDAKSSIVFHHDCTSKNIIKYRINENIKGIGAIGCRSIIEACQVKQRLKLQNMPFVCYSGAPNDAVEEAEKICTKQDYSEGIKYIYVGSLIKRKHMDVVLKAFNNIADSGDTLKVIGGGPEADNLYNLAKTMTHFNQIIFTGRIPRDKVLKEMKQAQVFTLISNAETYGMVYIEAMLQGCLVIASKGEGFDGIIKHGTNGFICEPGNQEMLESIYNKIKSMSIEERNKIGQAAIDTAIHFSEREVAERYLDDILNNQRG